MAKFKPQTISVIVLVAVVLGALGYLLGTLALSAATWKDGKIVTADTGVASIYEQPLAIKDFTLQDQTGTPYTLSASKGKVVVMTFLFTHCGDVCPYSALKMKLALEQLGVDASKVELVVIDTDPERDTVEVLAEYSRDLGLYDTWHMVTGPLDVMQKLYKDLMITVLKTDEEELQETAKNATELGIDLPTKDELDAPIVGLTEAQVKVGSDVARKYSGGYQIAHSAPFWILDTEGKLRQSLDVSASPAEIVSAVRTYLK